MIKPIDITQIPNLNNIRRGAAYYDMVEFEQSDALACEVDWEGSYDSFGSAQSAYQREHTLRFPDIKIVTRKLVIYLVKKGAQND